ncbi:MAG: Unknown protein [uncultured Sulfurovum sp.]|uniref:Uncharacterized protein n=1 Tax=uncultured Sulfurovum sp. TaxID=269237 RepID=A0A6S6TD66_9BACT|nr:MAG: Unknown protein [uncultured Sulfurovum sp.]
MLQENKDKQRDFPLRLLTLRLLTLLNHFNNMSLVRKILYISLLYTSTLFSGSLVEAFNHANMHNHNMKLAHSQLNIELASKIYQNKRKNIKLIADGFGRYYFPQASGLDNTNFNLPKKTVRESFLKGNVNITLSKELYNKEKDALCALAIENVKKASQNINQNRNHLLLDLIHQYFKVLENYDTFILSQERYIFSNQELEEARIEYNVGELDHIAYQLIKSKNLELKVAQNIYFNRVKNAIDDFELISQVKLKSFQPLEKNIFYNKKSIPSLQSYQEHIISTNPNLLKLDKDITISQKNIALTEAKYEPYLTAKMGYEYTNNFTPIFLGNTYESGVFIRLSGTIPIYTAGRYKAEMQKAKVAVIEKHGIKDKEENQLLVALKKEYRLYHSIPLEIEALRSHLQTLKLLENQAKRKIEVGTISFLEKERISLQYSERFNDLKRLEYNYFLADTNIKFLSGTLNISELKKLENELEATEISIKNLDNLII